MRETLLRRQLSVLPQRKTKKLNFARDFGREALMPGKRVSGNGKVYWETRMNRSDRTGRI